MIHTFKPNPKQITTDKATKKWGRSVSVDGFRLSSEDAVAAGYRSSVYIAQCTLNDEVVAAASGADWRAAYRNLERMIAQDSSHEE